MPITLPEAIAKFDSAAASGGVVNRKTGRTERLKPSRRGPILSNVRKAVIRALRAARDGVLLNESILETADIEPYLMALPEHGRLAAVEDAPGEVKAAGKVASNVRLFVSTILGRDIERQPKPVKPTRVPAAFRSLYDTLDAWVLEDLKKRRSTRRGFVCFVDLCGLHGIAAPEEVPDDYDTVMSWGERLGWKKKDVHYALTAWRKAVRLAEAPYGLALEVLGRNGIGIRSVPDLATRLKVGGFTGHLATTSTPELLRLLAPKLTEGLEHVIAAGHKDGLSEAWADALWKMESWLVASLLRLGEEVAALTWYDLWVERRAVAGKVDEAQDDQLAAYGISGGESESHSLMRRVMDTSAPISYQLSHLWLHNEEHELDDVPVYTDSILANFEAAYVVTKRFFGGRMHRQRPALWAVAVTEYENTLGELREYNRGRILLGRKPKSVLPITWPQMVCMGLPWLARRCYSLRREVADRLARIGHLESRESQRLVSEYCEALYEYAVSALIIDDSLRIKNYAGAIAGKHLRVTPIRENGNWVGIAELHTSFSALDDDAVSLKSKKMTGTEFNERTRRVTPGVVDHTLFFEYWTLARPRRLAAAGLLAAAEAFDPEDDEFAAFPTPRPSSEQVSAYISALAACAHGAVDGGKQALPAWRGNITEDMLTVDFGRTLHRVCIEVLGRDLPPWDDEELTKSYRGIFSAHIARLMAGSYFGGARQRWGDATYRTNTEEITLRRYYVRLSAWAKEREHLDSPEGLHWFDPVIDRLLKLKNHDDARWSQFWSIFDPARPSEALEWLDRPVSLAPANRRRRPLGPDARAA
ncbi:hypothetical protein [Gemmatimonas sp.]|uniref:hypothetical protein n=1 Tax=Gemmatimonas sp. TaxID=1962908 RepID=UPI0025C1D6A6|nr:hypothetical protein [Gemmatimonas sp.]MCA2991162.1 hypothetical protein [Gemmatimonas sp.]